MILVKCMLEVLKFRPLGLSQGKVSEPGYSHVSADR